MADILKYFREFMEKCEKENQLMVNMSELTDKINLCSPTKMKINYCDLERKLK